MNETDTETAPTLNHSQFLRIAFDALSAKAARWVVLGATCALFAAFVVWPSWIRLAGVATFAAMVFWPTWLRKDKPNG